MFTIKSAKAGFFDRESVIKAIGKANLKILKDFGRAVRKTAQKSLKYTDKTSTPGSPPSAHKTRQVRKTSRSTGKSRLRRVSLLREYILFSYDETSKTVVIGPSRLSGTSDPTAPERIEYGGTFRGDGRTIFVANEVSRDSKGKFVSGGQRAIKLTGTLTYKPRPFMRPALEAEKPSLEGMWKDSVR